MRKSEISLCASPYLKHGTQAIDGLIVVLCLNSNIFVYIFRYRVVRRKVKTGKGGQSFN